MFQYQYVTIYTGGGSFLDNSACEHREVIDRYAAEGWRFVGSIPTRFSGHGGTKELDLIFEKEV